MSCVPITATTSASMWPASHLLERRQMREARRAALQPIRLVGAVGHQIDAELALRRFDRGVGLAFRHAVAFGEELEVMDQRFHVALHLFAASAAHLAVVDHHRARVARSHRRTAG